jgi:hypothetical protein
MNINQMASLGKCHSHEIGSTVAAAITEATHKVRESRCNDRSLITGALE